jgi:predicted ATPase
MLTRIEIDGFKTFEGFSLNLRPFTAIVGPNASGKSNLFDALRFLSLLAQSDIRTAMQGLRGEPEELFRRTGAGLSDHMAFAVEVLLSPKGVDAFGTKYETPTRRLRYEIELSLSRNPSGLPTGIFVRRERCFAIAKKNDVATYLKHLNIDLKYNARVNPFIESDDNHNAILIRQDGPTKRGRPQRLPLNEASKTALSSITTAEYPHLYALRELMGNIRFLEISPSAARSASSRFEDRALKPDASNLAAVLAHLKEETATEFRPDGVLSDIAAELSSLIPSVTRLDSRTDQDRRQYSFSLNFVGDLVFSSRVISDGTLRLLALLTVLNDPRRRGTLCFEEPENGVHEGRVPMLVDFLRDAANISTDPDMPSFQILLNTHSPKVMAALKDWEIVAADSVVDIDPVSQQRSTKTRMRTEMKLTKDLINPETTLSRYEVEHMLQKQIDAA